MLIDLTCPAEIFGTELPTEEMPAATLTLFNLSDRVIVSAEVELQLLGSGGVERERLTYRGRALNGRPHSTFPMNVPCTPDRGIKSAEVTLEKIWFRDNAVWRRDPADTVEYTSNALPVSKALTNLKYVAGETAVGYPARENGLWICVCGRPNLEDDIFCVRCGQHRDTVFRSFTREAVEQQITQREKQLDLNSRNIREDTNRLQRLREEEYLANQARKRRRALLAAAVVLAGAVCWGAWRWGVPTLRLQTGRHALESGDAAAAKEIFASLGDFGGADTLLAECDWQEALVKAESTEDPEALAEAARLLRTMPDKDGAAEKADTADLARARLLLEAGDPDGALAALSQVPEDNEERTAIKNTCRMQEADALMAAENWEAAREIYLSLGSYEDAAEKAAQCAYVPAKAMMEAAAWDEAIALLSRIPEYADSRTLTLQCHYMKGKESEDAGDLEKASAEYLMAAGWDDAEDRMSGITYKLAEKALADGDLKSAQSLYASIPGWEDADDKNRACLYSLARRAAGEQEFAMALELLSDVPDEYEDTAAFRVEVTCRAARAAAKRGEWERTLTLLSSIDRTNLPREFRDIEDLYLQACRETGTEPYPEAAGEPTPEPSSNPYLVTDEE